MRRPTLEEKRYGEGFRPGPMGAAILKGDRCAVEDCRDPVYGSIELFVDDNPPALDWYTRLLSHYPPRTWVRSFFCQGHLAAVAKRALEYQEQPDLWAPWRNSPPVLPRPPKIVVPLD